MIQRVQSLYLLIGSVTQVLFATGTYFTFQALDWTYEVTGSGIFNNEGVKTHGDMKTLILGLAVAVFALVTIFLFKNRKQQMKFAKICGLLTLAQIVFLIISYTNAQELAEGEIGFGFATFILPISTILFFLASSAIKKDEDLVKSVDRIR